MTNYFIAIQKSDTVYKLTACTPTMLSVQIAKLRNSTNTEVGATSPNLMLVKLSYPLYSNINCYYGKVGMLHCHA